MCFVGTFSLNNNKQYRRAMSTMISYNVFLKTTLFFLRGLKMTNRNHHEFELPRLLRLVDVCKVSRTSRYFVYRAIKAGQLKAMKFGREWRFYPKDVKAWIEAHYLKE